jgi:benzoyl-CoA 2,3-dioxygenase component A
VIQQHLIDPEICIRCNTCEATCPIGAITHDDRNYVVRADVCNGCMACIAPCPTGSIDNWRAMPRARAYSIEDQLGWDELPAELPPETLTFEPTSTEGARASQAGLEAEAGEGVLADSSPPLGEATNAAASWGSTLPPWSAAHPYTQLYGPRAREKTVTATVTGNLRVTQAGTDCDTHHIVLDFGRRPFPVLEGQSIGIVPPGTDAQGRAHHPRQYSVASPRNGERPGCNNLSLTVKRVLEDHEGRPVRGVASNHLCNLAVGDSVQVTGPFGASFLMPNHAGANLVMICTGTGSAPMRAMTEWRRRQRSPAARGGFSAGATAPAARLEAAAVTALPPSEAGRLMLFFGARTQEELPYFGPLQNLPRDFIDIHLAFSRTPGQPKRYVQDLMRERAADLLPLLRDPDTFFYVCGLKSMEAGVVEALREVAEQGGLDWPTLGAALRAEGRLHLETY